MLNVKHFILEVREHPVLYNNKKNISEDADKLNCLWMQIAHKTGLKNGPAAEYKWRQLAAKYVSYLINGEPFAYAHEMQFMQMPLLLARSCESADADMELDEVALSRIIDADDGSEMLLIPPGNTEEGCNVISEKTKSTHAIRKAIKSQTKAKSVEQDKSEFQNSFENSYPAACETLATDDEIPALPITKEGNASASPLGSIKSDNSQPNKVMLNCNSGNFSDLTSLELIFLGYAKVLEHMPLPLQQRTKRKIADIMDEVELEMFDMK